MYFKNSYNLQKLNFVRQKYKQSTEELKLMTCDYQNYKKITTKKLTALKKIKEM
jgi:hypothetical protein